LLTQQSEEWGERERVAALTAFFFLKKALTAFGYASLTLPQNL
jgi:hypothetical protein